MHKEPHAAIKRYIVLIIILLSGCDTNLSPVTTEAIRRLYDVLNALAVLQPSEGLTQLIQQLQAIEDRARQYYISSGKPGTDPQPEPQPEPDGGDDQQDGDSDGEVTPVTPE